MNIIDVLLFNYETWIYCLNVSAVHILVNYFSKQENFGLEFGHFNSLFIDFIVYIFLILFLSKKVLTEYDAGTLWTRS